MFDRLEAHGSLFMERNALQPTAQMLPAISTLHAGRAVHRDIKSENLAFANDYCFVTNRSVLNDCSWTTQITWSCFKHASATVSYVPLEFAATNNYVLEEADMHALSLVLFVLFCFEITLMGCASREIPP